MGVPPLQRLLAEATERGVAFRVSGAEVIVDHVSALPEPIMTALRARRDEVHRYLSRGPSGESTNADLLAEAGIKVEIAKTEEQGRALLGQVLTDAGNHHLGLDMETATKPQFANSHPPVKLTRTGAVAKVQPRDTSRLGLDPHMAEPRLVQVHGGGDTCAVFDMRTVPWDVLKPLWSRRLVAHNAAFELLFLRAQGIGVDAFECTMQAGGLLLGVHRRSLAAVATEYLNWEIPKGLQTSDWAAQNLSKAQFDYAALDAVACFRLWSRLETDLQARKRWDAYTLQRDAIPGAVEMAWRGIGVDVSALEDEIDVWSRELGDAREAWVEATGKPPPGKPAEVRTWLQAALTKDESRLWPKTANTADLSVAADALERAAHHSAIRFLLKIKTMEKLLNTFGQGLLNMVNPVTGRLHAGFNVASTKSGRWSSSKPNLQQFPGPRIAPKFRRVFRAADGHVLVSADYGQMELRAAAEVSGDATLRRIYEDGLDLHMIQAAAMAGIAEEDVTPEQRSRAKPVNFGSVYGMSAKGLAAAAWNGYRVEMTEIEARQALDQFFQRFHQFRQWTRTHWNQCQERRRVVIGAGRVVEAAWELGGLRYTQCCNLPIQGACADAMMRAVAKVHRRLQSEAINGCLIASIHDELIAEVHQDHTEATKNILKSSMVEAFIETFPGAPTKNLVKVTTGHTWRDLK